MDTFEILNLAKVPQSYLSTKTIDFIINHLSPVFVDNDKTLNEKIYYVIDLPRECELSQIRELREKLDNQSADYFVVAKI